MSTINKLKSGHKAKKKDKEFDNGGLVNKESSISQIPTEITEMLAGILAEKKNSLLGSTSLRNNPSDVLRKTNALDTGSSLLSGAGKGAALGTAIAPGIGTAIGAGLGALTSGIGRIIGSGNRREELEKATATWSDSYSSKTAGALRAQGYKDGGQIKGPGTGKSDSVDMKAKDGSFVVPKENAEYAKELGITYLGWNDDEEAPKSEGNVDIKASNGEVIFNPEEVSILKYHGIDLDELAPKADKSKKINEMVKGGRVEPITLNKERTSPIIPKLYEKEEGPFPLTKLSTNFKLPAEPGIGSQAGLPLENDKDYNDWKYDPSNKLVTSREGNIGYDKSGNAYSLNPTTGKFEQSGSKSPYGAVIFGEYDESESAVDLLPELLGAVQSVGGAAGLMAAGRAPDMQISNTLKQLSSEVRKLSEFGYEPAVLNSLNAQIDRTRSDMSRLITEGDSSSGLEKMAQLQNILGTTIDKKTQLTFADAAEKARKYADVIRVDSEKARQEFDINRMNVDDWYRNQEVLSDLVAAGISNIIGSRQLKAEQDALKKIGNNSPSFKSK